MRVAIGTSKIKAEVRDACNKQTIGKTNKQTRDSEKLKIKKGHILGMVTSRAEERIYLQIGMEKENIYDKL